MGEHSDAGRVGVACHRRERFKVHAGEVGRRAIAPAVGEDLDYIGTIRERCLHARVRLFGRAGGECREVAPTGFSSVAARGAQPDSHVDARPGQHAVRKQAVHGRDRFAVGRVVVHRGDAARQVSFEVLAPIARHSCNAGGCKVRVQIEEPGQQRHAGSINHAGLRWNPRGASGGRNCFDTRAANHHGGEVRRRTRSVYDARSADRDNVLSAARNRNSEKHEESLHRWLSAKVTDSGVRDNRSGAGVGNAVPRKKFCRPISLRIVAGAAKMRCIFGV